MKATTIGQALKLGVATGDFEFDLRKGFEDCEKFGTPCQYEHKQGAVIWGRCVKVSITDSAARLRQQRRQGGDA